jgi:mono/diheme cytochrome c family protein
MAKQTQQYLFNEGQIRTIFIGTGIISISIIVGLLLLISTRPQGRLNQPDRTVFLRTLSEAASTLHSVETPGTGFSRIDIERAMELVVERGVDSPFITSEATEPLNVRTAEDPARPGEIDLPVQGDDPPADGAAVYSNCMGCHQVNGAGILGVFPSLITHAPILFNAEGSQVEGRTYLVQLLLSGLQGEITAGGVTYNGVMPAWPQLSDNEISAVLNHVLVSWGNDELVPDFEPYTAQEVEAQRERGLSPREVLANRQSLSLP